MVDVFAGVRTSFFVTDSAVRACGFNKDRALGCGRNESSIFTPVPIIVASKSEIEVIKSGSKHTVIQCKDGSLFGAGSNTKGQLGIIEGDAASGFVRMHPPI